jgi:ABC-type Mn2+/Zn2+ transport system ATPase subunit
MRVVEGSPPPPVTDPSPLVTCRDLTYAYDTNLVLRGVSFDVPAHGFVGLIGPNGCGKSTVMRVLLGLLSPAGGSVRVLDRAPLAAVRSGLVGYVPQRDTFVRAFPLAVRDVVIMGRVARVGLGRRPCRHDRLAAEEALARLGLADLGARAFGELSGGQQRLVLLARALAQEPRLLLMDEADTGLDELRRAAVYRELDQLRRERELGILAISHQLDLLATVVDKAVALRDGMSLDWCPTCMHHALSETAPTHRGARS